jgi:hypothetical protein
VTIICSEKEAATLAHALDEYLAELRIEAARTEPKKLAHALWEEERTLSSIRERLPR